jgi:hypothetical protein
MLDSLQDKKITSVIGLVLVGLGLLIQNFTNLFGFSTEISAALVVVGTALANLGKALAPAKSVE